jgi:hypothetical protein
VSLILADFEPVLKALQIIKQPPHSWVGGQAIIVWANRFLTPDEIDSSGLRRPLTSKDGDLRASEEVARYLAVALGGTVRTFKLKDPTRGKACALLVKLNNQEVIIDVLEKLPGVSESEPGFTMAVKAGSKDNNLTAKVLDPISLLLNKADVWRREIKRQADGAGKERRYDREHLALLGMLMPKYLTELQRWEHQGVRLKSTMEAERSRLQRFLDSNPTLPPGLHETLAAAIFVPSKGEMRLSDALPWIASASLGAPLNLPEKKVHRFPKAKGKPAQGKDDGKSKKSGRAD